MVKVIEKLIPDSVKPKFHIHGKAYVFSMKPTYITIHETANTGKGANAEAHANLQYRGNSRDASWHFTVDDKEAYQSLPTDECALHAGDGVYGTGNRNSIAIEICVNSDGDYKKAVKHAVELTKDLMDKYNIPISHIVQHHKWSGKDCPKFLRHNTKGIDWDDFIHMLEHGKPKPKDTTYKAKAQDTNSIVDYMKANDMDASFENRKKLASKYGIENYRGTASQNLALLKKLRTHAKPASVKKQMKALDETSIVDFLKANNMDSSFEARAKLAEKYGIKNYKGTASQNVRLLKALKK